MLLEVRLSGLEWPQTSGQALLAQIPAVHADKGYVLPSQGREVPEVLIRYAGSLTAHLAETVEEGGGASEGVTGLTLVEAGRDPYTLVTTVISSKIFWHHVASNEGGCDAADGEPEDGQIVDRGRLSARTLAVGRSGGQRHTLWYPAFAGMSQLGRGRRVQ